MDIKKQPKAMQQTLVLVQRGVTDRTPVLCWPWEAPILEVIHGEGNVITCDHEETIKWLQRNKVHVLKPGRTRSGADDDHTNIQGPEDFNPANDVGMEYDRMIGKYGMHLEIKMPNVEYVYGRLSEGRFEKAVLAHCQATKEVSPTYLAAPRKMTGAEIRAELDKLDVEYDPTATVAKLKQLLQQHMDTDREEVA